jgi:hypothetical protein
VKRFHMIWIAVALSAPASGAGVGAAEPVHRQHGAHVHGEARLDVALEGDKLVLQLETPAVNVVGFEHPPASPEESGAVERATRLLKDGATLFVPAPEAKCRLADAKVTSEGMEAGAGVTAEADPDERDEDADHEGHHHAEFQAEYHFACDAPDRLDSLEVRLFAPFPGTHKVHVQLVTPRMQAASDLTADDTRMKF